MSYLFDSTRVEQSIRQAEQERAKHVARVLRPALRKTIGGLFALLAALLPFLKGGSGA
jgi:hypothetical protein